MHVAYSVHASKFISNGIHGPLPLSRATNVKIYSSVRPTHLHQEDSDRFGAELPRQAAEEDQEHEDSQTERVVHACSALQSKRTQ